MVLFSLKKKFWDTLVYAVARCATVHATFVNASQDAKEVQVCCVYLSAVSWHETSFAILMHKVFQYLCKLLRQFSKCTNVFWYIHVTNSEEIWNTCYCLALFSVYRLKATPTCISLFVHLYELKMLPSWAAHIRTNTFTPWIVAGCSDTLSNVLGVDCEQIALNGLGLFVSSVTFLRSKCSVLQKPHCPWL